MESNFHCILFPMHTLTDGQDFITSNALDNIKSIPANPHRIYVDTRIGDKNLLDPSGEQCKDCNSLDAIACLSRLPRHGRLTSDW